MAQSGPFTEGEAAGATTNHWKKGDIAFLHWQDQWCHEDDIAMRRYVPYKATGHPVIVLDVAPGCALITTVSAYSSSAATNFLPPWRQEFHQGKNPEDFRSFFGSERVSDRYPALRLLPGESFPKPRTSWVWVQSAWVVPLRLLGRFTKVRGHVKLRMLPESLEELRRHMARACHAWADGQRRLAAARRAASATHRAALPAADAPAAVPAPAAAASASAAGPAPPPTPARTRTAPPPAAAGRALPPAPARARTASPTAAAPVSAPAPAPARAPTRPLAPAPAPAPAPTTPAPRSWSSVAAKNSGKWGDLTKQERMARPWRR